VRYRGKIEPMIPGEFLKGVRQIPIADTSISKKWRVSQIVLKWFFFSQLQNRTEATVEHLKKRPETLFCGV
jgi:hypothetical protein